MSVLYKALQKAAKENEEQAAVHGNDADAAAVGAFDPERLAGSGAISSGRSSGVNWRVAGAASAVVLAVVLVAVFFLFDSDQPASVQVAQQPVAPAPVVSDMSPAISSEAASVDSVVPQAQTEVSGLEDSDTDLGIQPGAESDDVAAVVAAPVAPAAVAPAAPAAVAPDAPAAVAPVAPATAPVNVAQAPVPLVPTPAPSQTSTAQAATAPIQAPPAQFDPMPRLGPDSLARVLSPPISIRRADAEFAGAGDLVQVREVSQSAQDNVTAGYNALVRGDVGSALELYTQALSTEPTSVMAQLGRSASLQRLGRLEEARAGY